MVSTAFASQYNDVENGAWYSNAVNYVTENNLMTGTDSGRFSPNIPITRGMMVTILHRMEGMPAVSGNSVFLDVPENSYYATAIAWAAENNITSGTSADRFSPDDQITREQFATLIYRYADMKGYDTSAYEGFDGFSDAIQISSFAQNAMHWAVGSELLGGSDGNLSPKGVATRAQVAEIFMRFTQNISRKASDESQEENTTSESQYIESEHDLKLSDMQVKITSQGQTATFRLYDTVAAKELYDQLPIELELTNFRNAQWMFYPPQKLNVTENEAYHDGKKGELSYYEPWGDVFMLYEDFYAGDEMHRLGIGLTGIDNIEGMSGRMSIEKDEVTQTTMEEEMNIRVKANGNTIDFKLNDIQAARDLYAQLPLTVDVENYGSNEKIFYPTQRLNTANAPLVNAQSASGTLAYFAPWGNVVIFYGSSDSASGLYELGHAISGSENIQNLSGEIQIEKIED